MYKYEYDSDEYEYDNDSKSESSSTYYEEPEAPGAERYISEVELFEEIERLNRHIKEVERQTIWWRRRYDRLLEENTKR